jgi:c-di-GMP-binding flagellar brake protein YcgR
MKERRRFIRLSAHHLLKYKLINREKELSFAHNISAGGVLFHAKSDIAPGELIELEINFPGYPTPVKAISKVVRTEKAEKVEGFNVAAEFVNIEEGAKDFVSKKIQDIQGEIEQ